jgi:hypothetical protein
MIVEELKDYLQDNGGEDWKITFEKDGKEYGIKEITMKMRKGYVLFEIAEVQAGGVCRGNLSVRRGG